MSQFRQLLTHKGLGFSYDVDEIPSDRDKSQYIHTVEIAALEAAQKEILELKLLLKENIMRDVRKFIKSDDGREITELKKENYEIRCERQGWMNRIAEAEYVEQSCLEQLKMYKAALKVAEDALMYMTEDFDCDAEDVALFDMLKAKEALSEIQKIKKGLG